MLLKRLEAYGFKSFADKLEIEFGAGITAIVGPNGSGKSNITDAVRWVLGEQNVRSLRGAKAEDIIFTGSASRRPLGAAEVSITFDNSDRRLPLDFEEIQITRRLFRSGESEFFINKAKCRLKDIYNLFADTGLGKNSLSVIGQNKVDEVLNTKPEDRRYFFEECAGITKYRDRKKEASRKLDNTQANLVRLADIIGEIEKQLEPLQKQAEKTQRYNVIDKEYKNCRLTQILYKYEKNAALSSRFADQIKEFETQRASLEATVSVSEADTVSQKNEIAKLEKKLRRMSEDNQRVRDEIERSRNQATLLQERIRQSCQSQQKLQERQASVRDELKLTQADSDELARKAAIAGATADKLEQALREEQNKAQQIEQSIAGREKELQSRQEAENESRRLLEEEQRRLLLMQRDLSDIDGSIASQKQARRRAMQEQIEKRSSREALDASIAATAKKIKSSRDAISAQKSKLEQLTLACADKSALIDKMKSAIRAAEDKQKFFKDMQESYEGFGKAVKRILKSEEDWHSGICGAVAELIHVEDTFITAIETALGSAMQNIVVKDTDTAKAAIAYLKEHKFGRATFLPLTAMQPHRSKKADAEPGKYGFIAYADELVDIDERYRVITQSLLGRILVVDGIDNALKLARLNDYRLRIVTLEGELLQPGGAVSGGAGRNSDTGYLHRAGELSELKDYLASQRQALRKAQSEYEADDGRRQALAEALNEQQQNWQELSLLAAQKQVESNQLSEWFKNQENIIASVDGRISALIVKRTAVEADIEAQNDKIAAMQKKMGDSENSHEDIKDAIEGLRAELKAQQQLMMRRQISCTEARQEVIRHSDKLKLLKQQCERSSAFLADSEQEMASLQKVIDDSLAELKRLEESAANLEQLQKSGKDEYDNIYKRQLGLKSELSDMDEERAKIAVQVNAVKDEIHKCEVAAAKVETELKQCVQQLQDEYDMPPEAALQHRLELSDSELKAKLKQLESELKAIGPVNPHAVEEYQSLRERCDFMTKQVDDLQKAKEDLLKIIEQIDKTMAAQFAKAFAEIKVHFNDIFRQLFGGGRADLVLTKADDVLSTGIEIEAQPPDKKPQSLSVLSGGERTLTVIALLFAFFTYSPAPFSVLDEIDAPLDEANVKRFAKFLRDYAQRTQFILVTHRRGTMEAADVMYGVTIEDAGVSKLISVKLDDYK